MNRSVVSVFAQIHGALITQFCGHSAATFARGTVLQGFSEGKSPSRDLRTAFQSSFPSGGRRLCACRSSLTMRSALRFPTGSGSRSTRMRFRPPAVCIRRLVSPWPKDSLKQVDGEPDVVAFQVAFGLGETGPGAIREQAKPVRTVTAPHAETMQRGRRGTGSRSPGACTKAMEGQEGDGISGVTVCSRNCSARNGDSERMSLVYRSRPDGVLERQEVDGIAQCARHALGPTPLGPCLAAKVAKRPDKCRQGTPCISDAWGVKNSAARAVSRQTPSASSIRWVKVVQDQ